MIIDYLYFMTTTIPLSRELKEVLEKLKGSMTWDEFLESLIYEVFRIRREKSRKELAKLFESSFEEVRVEKWSREY